MVLLAVAGCTRPAPDLPPDLSALPPAERLLPADHQHPTAALDCPGLVTVLGRNLAETYGIESGLGDQRPGDQAVGYFSAVFFPPLALAAPQYEAEKKALDRLQADRDTILRLHTARGCEPILPDTSTWVDHQAEAARQEETIRAVLPIMQMMIVQGTANLRGKLDRRDEARRRPTERGDRPTKVEPTKPDTPPPAGNPSSPPPKPQ